MSALHKTKSPSSSTEIGQTFHHTIGVYLKDSNAYGNVYFARHFEWQGICREKWFHDCLSSEMLEFPGIFVTHCAHQDYLKETFPFDTVECSLNTAHVGQCSAYLLFSFSVKGQPVARGYQKVVYTNSEGKITKFPQSIRERAKEFEIDPTPFGIKNDVEIVLDDA